MHAGFELAHVDGGREVRVTTTVFSAVKRLSQKRQQIDKQNQHNILRSAIWSMGYRHERGATRGIPGVHPVRDIEFDGWACRATAGRWIEQSPCHAAAILDWRAFQRLLKDADGAKCCRVPNEYSNRSRAVTNTR